MLDPLTGPQSSKKIMIVSEFVRRPQRTRAHGLTHPVPLSTRRWAHEEPRREYTYTSEAAERSRTNRLLC